MRIALLNIAESLVSVNYTGVALIGLLLLGYLVFVLLKPESF